MSGYFSKFTGITIDDLSKTINAVSNIVAPMEDDDMVAGDGDVNDLQEMADAFSNMGKIVSNTLNKLDITVNQPGGVDESDKVIDETSCSDDESQSNQAKNIFEGFTVSPEKLSHSQYFGELAPSSYSTQDGNTSLETVSIDGQGNSHTPVGAHFSPASISSSNVKEIPAESPGWDWATPPVVKTNMVLTAMNSVPEVDKSAKTKEVSPGPSANSTVPSSELEKLVQSSYRERKEADIEKLTKRVIGHIHCVVVLLSLHSRCHYYPSLLDNL